LVEQTCQAGVSIAGLAQAHAINANQLHKWLRTLLGVEVQATGVSSALIPVTIARPSSRSSRTRSFFAS